MASLKNLWHIMINLCHQGIPPTHKHSNNVTASKDVCWINKTKHVIFHQWWKALAIQSAGTLLCTHTLHLTVPSNPEKLHLVRLISIHPRTDVDTVGMIYPKNSGTSKGMDNVWVLAILMDENHYITVRH